MQLAGQGPSLGLTLSPAAEGAQRGPCQALLLLPQVGTSHKVGAVAEERPPRGPRCGEPAWSSCSPISVRRAGTSE